MAQSKEDTPSNLRPLLAAISFGARTPPAAASSGFWSYEGEEGPKYRDERAPNFATCSTGQQQSPSDPPGVVAAHAKGIVLNWIAQLGWTVVKNCHTIEANAENAGTMMEGDTTCKLLQFHFHSTSQHAIDGSRVAMGCILSKRPTMSALRCSGR